MNRKAFRTDKVALLAMTVMLAVFVRSAGAESYQYLARKIPNPEPTKDFRLTGPDGKPFALSSLRGKLVLLDFGFTHCPNTCPTALANLAVAYERLSPADQARVQLLFVTIDPKRDTVAVLKGYVPFFNKNFIGLTGTPEEIAAVAKTYEVEYEVTNDWGGNADNYTLNHTAGALLLDPAGKWIASYGATHLLQSERVADDLRHFLHDPNLNTGNWESVKRGLVKTPQLSGRELYVKHCASCHGEDGTGIQGKYRALAGSALVTGAPNRLTALVLNGLSGESQAGATGQGVMPAWWHVIVPADISAILTYIRQAWGNDAPAVSAAYINKLGYQFGTRPNFWTWKELDALPPDKSAAASGL